MEWHIPDIERTYLRDLARRQSKYAALPIMAAREQMWYELNDGRFSVRPPVVIETWTFDRDFMPESLLRCVSKAGRTVERQLLRNVRNFELIDDDKVMPNTFDIGWFVDIDELGIKIETETVKDAQGVETGYRFLHPIKDLERDLHSPARRMSRGPPADFRLAGLPGESARGIPTGPAAHGHLR